jgi:hypothetical protein
MIIKDSHRMTDLSTNVPFDFVMGHGDDDLGSIETFI